MTDPKLIWVVDDERSIRWVLEKALTSEGYTVMCFDNGQAILDMLRAETPDAIISDIRMPGIDGLELLGILKKQYPVIPVIIMTAHSDLESAVSSIRGGAFEYLAKPFEIDDALAVVQRALAEATNNTSSVHATDSPPQTEIIGKATAMQEVFKAIARLSNSNITVLLNGQSGTGKELVAQALHRHSPRRNRQFIALNMAAIPHDLIESELFGHEKGAFTGAAQFRVGRFEQADGGTLLLDEIGDMPAETQIRLLRVLSDGEFYRVGGHSPIRVDVRIIAATHQNLEELVSQNRFREDLFHRLNVIRIHIPTLAERREDIPVLLNHFLHQAARELNVEPKSLSDDTMRYLSQLAWPGNVRQLENTCRWLTVMASGQLVIMEDLPSELLGQQQNRNDASDWESALRRWTDRELIARQASDDGILDRALPMFERIMIEVALKNTGGRKRDAAVTLGWGRNTLTRKMKELGMETVD